MTPERIRWVVGTTILVFLCVGAYAVLKTFIVPVAWAGVLCFATWPIYRMVLHWVGHREALAVSIMTSLLLVAVVLPVLLSSWLLAQEVQSTYDQVKQLIQEPPTPPEWLQSLPVVGPRIREALDSWRQDPESLKRLLLQNAGAIQDFFLSLVGRLGRNIAKVVLTLMTAFFFYRHGEDILAQAGAVARRFTGERAHQRFQVVGQTIRAVVYGLLFTALAQGLLAAVGYAVAGVPAPVLLGAGTGLLALIPFGAPFVWLPAGVWLLVNQSTLAGIGLLAWGAFVVSGIDNVLRPYFISGATRIPYLLVFFGVLGGISAFGLIGLFIGPTILSVLLALWREWVTEELPEADLVKADEETPPDTEGKEN